MFGALLKQTKAWQSADELPYVLGGAVGGEQLRTGCFVVATDHSEPAAVTAEVCVLREMGISCCFYC